MQKIIYINIDNKEKNNYNINVSTNFFCLEHVDRQKGEACGTE